jgi:carnitine monooxygenase subunit
MKVLPVNGFVEDVRLSRSFSPHLYTDPENFLQERQRIFRSSWHFVCHRSELPQPGAYLAAQVDDQNIFLIRDDSGTIRAYFNVCQHRGHELVQGRGTMRRIVCPYHAWCYRLDGSLQAVTGGSKVETQNLTDIKLKAVAVDDLCGFIFINFDTNAPSIDVLMPQLRADILQRVPNAEQLVLLGESTGVVQANWKVAIENSLECYHCGVVHKNFCQSVDMQEYRSSNHGRFHRHVGPMFETDSQGQRIEGDYVYWHLWPLTEFSVRTHTPVFSVYQSRPLNAGSTEITLKGYVPAGLSAAEQQRILHDYILHNATDAEDVSIVESVQKGISSLGYSAGRFVVDAARTHISEHSVHHFQKLVLDAMEIR